MHHFLVIRRLLAMILLSSATNGYGQNGSTMVTSPFDSITVVSATAVGHASTGSVDLTIKLKNGYHRTAQLPFGSGVYADFGLLDDRGSRYCLFHSERLQSKAITNQG